MSDPRDRVAMRDPTLDAAWCAHSTELPPPHVDAAILAAARREAHSRPRAVGDEQVPKDRPSRAWWGVAAAATISALAFGVLQLAPSEAPIIPAPVSDVPSSSGSASISPPASAPAPPPIAPAEREPSAQASAPAPATTPRPATPPAQSSRERAQSRPLRDRVAAEPSVEAAKPEGKLSAPSPAPRPFPGAEAPTDQSRALAKREADAPRERASALAEPQQPADAAAKTSRNEARRDERMSQAAGASAPAPSARAAQPPDAWISRIVALYNAGQRDDAERELRAFREAYVDADQRLPESLRAWATSVKR